MIIINRPQGHNKLNMTEQLRCQGECNKHGECKGEVQKVVVYGTFCPDGLTFNYCQTARETDETRGFVVELVETTQH